MTVPPANVDRTSRPAGRARGPSTLQMGTAAHGHPQACPHRAVGAGAHPGRFCLQSPLPHWLTNTRPAVLWWRLRDEEGRGLPSRAPASLAARQQAGGGMEERSSWPGCLGPSRRRPTSLHAGPWGRAAAPRGPSVRTRPPPPRRGWPRPSSVTHGVPRCGVSSAPGARSPLPVRTRGAGVRVRLRLAAPAPEPSSGWRGVPVSRPRPSHTPLALRAQDTPGCSRPRRKSLR